MKDHDTAIVTFPSFVIALPPFRFLPDGESIDLSKTAVWSIESTNGPVFLLLFRKRNLVRLFLDGTGYSGETSIVPIEDGSDLQELVSLLVDRFERPTGVLLDPDEDCQGYPLGPENFGQPEPDLST